MTTKRSTRRTLKKYEDLYRDPTCLFPGNELDSRPVKVILWPNGYPAIWLQDESGRTFEIRAGRGFAGFSVRVEPIGVLARADVSGNRGSRLEGFHVKDACHIEVCQYDQTEQAQSHRRWYAGEGPHPSEVAELENVPPTSTADADEAFAGKRADQEQEG